MSDTNQEATSVQDIVDVLVNQRNNVLAVNANLEAKLTLALKEINTLKNKERAEDLFSVAKKKDNEDNDSGC
tara:strand:+ start:1498 stop:1713 length:216 start_codon:yes stop_codon:yes gene_type:complete